MDGELKATGFLSLLKVLQEEVGAERFAAMVAWLAPDTAAVVNRPPMPMEWLPLRHHYAVVGAAHRVLYNGDDARCFTLGSRLMRDGLSGVYRVFIRLASPDYVIDRTTQLWATYRRHDGTLEVTRREPHLVELTYHGVSSPGRPHWEVQRGAVAGVLKMTGVRDVKVTYVEGGVAPKVPTVMRATWA